MKIEFCCYEHQPIYEERMSPSISSTRNAISAITRPCWYALLGLTSKGFHVRLETTVCHLGINAHSARLVFDAARILLLRLSSKGGDVFSETTSSQSFFET